MPPTLPLTLLILVAILLAWFVHGDAAEYKAFKALSRSEDRCRAFRRWTLRSFAGFGCGALMVLFLLGRTGALLRVPDEFAPLSRAFSIATNEGHKGVSTEFALYLLGGAIAGSVIGGLVAALLKRRAGKPRTIMVGDVEPLLPRNAEERRWTALLAANAGPSEELLFRLVLPLLLTLVTGSAAFAFAASALVFGAVHFYQGWVGIAATTILGLLFTALYLATGSIWIAAALHSAMNLNSLWLRPWLAERRGRAP